MDDYWGFWCNKWGDGITGFEGDGSGEGEDFPYGDGTLDGGGWGNGRGAGWEFGRRNGAGGGFTATSFREG